MLSGRRASSCWRIFEETFGELNSLWGVKLVWSLGKKKGVGFLRLGGGGWVCYMNEFFWQLNVCI